MASILQHLTRPSATPRLAASLFLGMLAHLGWQGLGLFSSCAKRQPHAPQAAATAREIAQQPPLDDFPEQAPPASSARLINRAATHPAQARAPL